MCARIVNIKEREREQIAPETFSLSLHYAMQFPSTLTLFTINFEKNTHCGSNGKKVHRSECVFTQLPPSGHTERASRAGEMAKDFYVNSILHFRSKFNHIFPP
jgi:hypothetical protein